MVIVTGFHMSRIDEIQINLDIDHFHQRFKDWVENNSLKHFTTYWQQIN